MSLSTFTLGSLGTQSSCSQSGLLLLPEAVSRADSSSHGESGQRVQIPSGRPPGRQRGKGLRDRGLGTQTIKAVYFQQYKDTLSWLRLDHRSGKNKKKLVTQIQPRSGYLDVKYT